MTGAVGAGAAVSDLNDVMLALGRVQEGVDRLREDFDREKISAAQSRKAIYERHEELGDALANLRKDVEISALISAQGREEMKRLAAKVEDHREAIQPSIEDWKRIKTLGLGVTGVLAIGGLSVGAMLSMGLEAFKAALRQFLGG